MVDRKWENLPHDCLVDIFSKVGLGSLVEGVPYVCKSWYKATLSPQCWQSLLFPRIMENSHRGCYSVAFSTDFPMTQEVLNCTVEGDRSHEELVLYAVSIVKSWYKTSVSPLRWQTLSFQRGRLARSHEAFVKFVIGRSKGSANGISFQSGYMTQEVLNCISDGCPSLKWLVLPSYDFLSKSLVLSSSFCKWKDLEALSIGRGFSLAKIIPEISIHCKNFVWLSAVNVVTRQSEASAIANLLPNIKRLSFRDSWIERSHLLTIMKGCKNLENLELRFCIGFDVDEEILNLAAHVATVNFEGSKLRYYD